MKLSRYALAAALAGTSAPATAQPVPAATAACEEKARLIVDSDIGNKPDDQMSLVRLLLYADEIDVEGLVASTSVWLRRNPQPERMHAVIAGYALARPRLMANAAGWPEATALDAMVAVGQPGYGMAAVGPGLTSAGAQAIIRAADRPDPRPLWIGLWGGANTLAQALSEVRATRSPAAVDAFVARLRVGAIADQDDAGPWIRREFPKLTYIVSPSLPDNGNYAGATWTGISGDVFYRNAPGADGRTVTYAWLDAHIRRGPLGALYPRFDFIMEGDSPAFMNLVRNGLAGHCDPGWGGWGGRYVLRRPYGETRPIWTQGGDPFGRITSADTVTGATAGPIPPTRRRSGAGGPPSRTTSPRGSAGRSIRPPRPITRPSRS